MTTLQRSSGWRARWAQAKLAIRAGMRSYGRILAYVRPYWRQLSAAAVSLVLISLLSLAMPWAVQRLIDSVIVGQDLTQLNRIALILAGIFAVRAALSVAYTYLISWIGERVVADLRRSIYEHLMVLSLRFFDSRRVGEIISRLTNDVQIIQNAATSNLVVLLQEIVTAVGVIVVMWTMNWRLTALMAVALPGVVLVTRVMGRRIRRITRAVQDTLAEASAVVEETVSGIRTVMSFAREEHEIDRFGQKVTMLFKAAMQRTRVYATLGPIISLLMYGSLALVLWYGGREVLVGRLTAGQLIAFLFYATMLTGPLGGLASLYGQVQVALGAAERIFELLDARSEIFQDPMAEPLPPIIGDVAFRDVSFEYDPRQPVLRNITLEARPGQVVALVGPSGVGKTTLVNLIPRFYDPTGGQIEIDGHDVRCVTLRSVRDQIGIVPQETLLFSDTIASNIRYGKLDATQQEIEAAARAANAHDFIIHELPDGYETQVGERGVKLSGGQRQRIAIARAILKDPRILILDEATSSLDTESEKLVQEALERLMHPGQPGTSSTPTGGSDPVSRTTFVIAHRLSTITTADWIVVLNEGQVVEQGTHVDLLAQEGSLYRHYHALQFRWDEERPPQPGEAQLHPLPEEEPWSGLAAPFLESAISPDPYTGPGERDRRSGLTPGSDA